MAEWFISACVYFHDSIRIIFIKIKKKQRIKTYYVEVHLISQQSSWISDVITGRVGLRQIGLIWCNLASRLLDPMLMVCSRISNV